MRNMTKRRRALMISSDQSRLPEEFQEVQWLQGTGSQYFELAQYGIGLTSDNHFYGIKGDIEELNATRYSLLTINAHSGRPSQAQYTEWNVKGSYGDLDAGYYPYNASEIKLRVQDELSYHFEINRNSIIINNSVLNNPQFPSGSYCANLYIGARLGSNETLIVENSNVKIKSIKLTYDDSVIYELIPCYRKADSKAGLFYWIDYSQGSSGFITNSGSGSDFLVGPDA